MASSKVTAITAEEACTRAEAVASARQSVALEGGECSPRVRELQEAFIAGELTAEELTARTLALYGVG